MREGLKCRKSYSTPIRKLLRFPLWGSRGRGANGLGHRADGLGYARHYGSKGSSAGETSVGG